MAVREVVIPYAPRVQFIPFHERTERFSVIVAHRRAGKTVATLNDLIRRAIEGGKPDGRYAYVAPYYSQAKDVAWSYLKRYAQPLLSGEPLESELSVTLVNGAKIRLYGGDNPDRLRGIYLDGVVLDEVGDMRPSLWPEIVRPLLTDRRGWATFIGTPRGRNAFCELWEGAQEWGWFSLMLRASETSIIAPDELVDAKRMMAREQYEQEFECSFAASNLGAILGPYVEDAEREGRIADVYPQPRSVELSLDIGYRDTTACWQWEPHTDGFLIAAYDESVGLDAQDWIDRIKAYSARIDRIWLPHDARNKTFQTKHSVLEQFLEAFGASKVRIVPMVRKQDLINAARIVMPRCRFMKTACKSGLLGLKEWSFDYDEDKKVFSKEPRHDWASHPGDAFAYGALVMNERVVAPIKPKHVIDTRPPTLNELWDEYTPRRQRI